MNIFVTGATGTIGSHLCPALLTRGHKIVGLTRSGDHARSLSKMGVEPVLGDATKNGPWISTLQSADVVIHLAGAGIFVRWTRKNREKIRSSRVDSTRLIAGAISGPSSRVKLLLCGSATGYYGSDAPEPKDESATGGNDFLAQVCIAWERAACVSRADVRTVTLRSAMVLTPDGGALKTMLPFFRLGLGGRLGHGRQVMSWIHIDDWVRATLFLLERQDLKGAFNLAAPYAVRNEEFAKILGQCLRRPAVFPVPAAVMKMALGDVATVALGNQHVRPAKLLEAGFQFSFPEIRMALAHLLKRP